MANKPKWLEEGTTADLLEELGSIVSIKMDKAGVNKAKKIIKELKERLPEDGDDTVVGLLDQIATLAGNATSLYNEEAEQLAEVEDDDEDDDDDEEEDDEEDDDEEDDDDDDEDDDDEDDDEDEEDEEEVDLSTLSLAELKKLGKEEYGIKGTKKWKKKAVAIKAILAVAEEDDEEEDYSDWSIQQFRKEAKKRGIKAGASATKEDFRKLLLKDDKK